MDQQNQKSDNDLGRLWMAYQENPTSELREKLILAHAPLVKRVVGHMGLRPDGPVEWEDLENYGIIGLIDAVERYEPNRGVPFSAFASNRIRGSVLDALRQLDPLGRLARRRVRAAQEAIERLSVELGRLPEGGEVAEAIGLSDEQYEQVLQDASLVVMSLEHSPQIQGEGDSRNLSDTLEDTQAEERLNQVEEDELRLHLMHAISMLPRREQILLSLYYGEELTMREIARVMDISQTRVCQLHARAVLNLRATMAPAASSPAEDPVPKQPETPYGERVPRQHLWRNGNQYNVLPSAPGLFSRTRSAEA